jgi:hypothetical protein
MRTGNALVVFQPGGMEAYCEELFGLLNAEGGFPSLGTSKFAELAHRFNTYAPDEWQP